MDKALVSLFCLGVFFVCPTPLVAETPSPIVVFAEPGFPTADSASTSPEQLQKLMPGARFSTMDQLSELLDAPTTRLLVLPYGSAFPEESWPHIYTFL
ncbi:MAG TPA: hypothetical protein VHM88_09040, partial [Candidatus Acidoferrales bacterium]|nr:hypothetical protein [Candidatus Acidoferrales bacterium]